jgi:hypothetical protein
MPMIDSRIPFLFRDFSDLNYGSSASLSLVPGNQLKHVSQCDSPPLFEVCIVDLISSARHFVLHENNDVAFVTISLQKAKVF